MNNGPDSKNVYLEIIPNNNIILPTPKLFSPKTKKNRAKGPVFEVNKNDENVYATFHTTSPKI